MTEHITVKQAFSLIAKMTGQANIIAVPRIYIDIFEGDLKAAMMLSQCIYWADKKNGKPFYKTDVQWERELGLGRYQVQAAKARLVKMGLITTFLKKVNGAPTTFYRVNSEAVIRAIEEAANAHQYPDDPDDPDVDIDYDEEDEATEDVGFPESQKSNVWKPDNRMSDNQTIALLETSKSIYTETTSKTTTETTEYSAPTARSFGPEIPEISGPPHPAPLGNPDAIETPDTSESSDTSKTRKTLIPGRPKGLEGVKPDAEEGDRIVPRTRLERAVVELSGPKTKYLTQAMVAKLNEPVRLEGLGITVIPNELYETDPDYETWIRTVVMPNLRAAVSKKVNGEANVNRTTIINAITTGRGDYSLRAFFSWKKRYTPESTPLMLASEVEELQRRQEEQYQELDLDSVRSWMRDVLGIDMPLEIPGESDTEA